jgi:cytochrome c-type biogenesis protein CcmH
MRRIGLWVAVLAGLLAVSSASAQEPTPPPRPSADDVNRVASNLYCPVCENEPLDVCQTPACVQWKAQIGQFLAEGMSEQEIVQIFVERYGLRVLGEPPATGITLILWIGPIVAALAGGLFAFRLIRRMSQRAATAPLTPAQAKGDEYVDRVEQELKQRL